MRFRIRESNTYPAYYIPEVYLEGFGEWKDVAPAGVKSTSISQAENYCKDYYYQHRLVIVKEFTL